ncbi:MAG: hypothetical protein HQK79_18480 [Desulfobacterales bacterium]|nr:hypothetical protein [Desulfobacterales bacterium]
MGINQTIISESKKKYFGEYIGKVENTDDPDKFMRVQVRVFEIFTDNVPASDLPWAEYKLPIGSRVNDGFFTPVKAGDYVWIDFPYNGDTRRPRITGSVHYCPGKIPNLPKESFESNYHQNCVYTQNNVTIEINTDSSFTLTQKTTGTKAHIDSTGKVTVKSNNMDFDGGSSDLAGIITGLSICHFTGHPHVDVSKNVKSSKG